MKTKFACLLLALFGLTFTSCSESDDDPGMFPPTVTDAMKEKLNDALKVDFPFTEGKKVEWESDTQNKCFIAEFKGEDTFSDVEAWYNFNYNLVMTEYDYGENVFLAPAELSVAINESNYATWNVDDIKYYKFPTENRSFYEVEVETSGQPDTYLYYRISTNPQDQQKVYELYKTTTTPYIVTPSFTF